MSDSETPPKRQRILVLGASGFIGRKVVRMLAGSEWAFPIAASHRTSLGEAMAVESVRLDARDPAAMSNALDRVDGVVNCITGDFETIVGSARALFAACTRLPTLPRIVHLSTMMVYGTAAGTVDEATTLRGDWDDYSAAKMEVEKMARDCKSVVHLRPGIVYGPQSPIWSGRIGRWLLQHRLGDLGSAGVGFCNLVHIDDVVEAVGRALRKPGIEGEAFNLSSPSPPTWNEYFRQFASALGTDFVTISRTRLALERYLLAPPLKIAEIVSPILPFAWQPAEPIRPWLLRLCGQPLRLDTRKAERVLGMMWKPLDKGLSESAAWVLGYEKAQVA
jgi:nucleoside-diphosphate-sugar epimerase